MDWKVGDKVYVFQDEFSTIGSYVDSYGTVKSLTRKSDNRISIKFSDIVLWVDERDMRKVTKLERILT